MCFFAQKPQFSCYDFDSDFSPFPSKFYKSSMIFRNLQKYSIQSFFYQKMKIFGFFAAAAVFAADETEPRKVPPRHPLQRLETLVRFSGEILTQWFYFLPSQQNWILKFQRNAKRRGDIFEICFSKNIKFSKHFLR